VEENTKLNFFNRIKIAIFKLEDYGMFLGERLSVAIKYFFILILILSIVISVIDSYDFSKMIGKVYNYIENELPDFVYEDGKITFSENVEAYDEDYQFRLFINTDEEVNEETISDYKTQIYNEQYGMIALKDKFIYIVDGNEIEYSYSDLLTQYSLDINNKNELVEKISEISSMSIVMVFFVMNLIAIYISNIITMAGDLLVVALFGYVAARICGIRFKLSPVFSLSIYSLTLSIVLTGIYSVVYTLTGFVIKYFDIMYLLIAYVYIIAAIMMIKYDLIKHHFEVEKIIEVQKKVHDEVEEEKQDKENNDEEDNKKDNENKDKKDSKENNNEPQVDEEPQINREPDGSEI
jgi:hypothetical protein